MPADLAPFIEHTLLTPDAAAAEIDRLCAEAVEHGLRAVCVNPYWVRRAASAVRDSPVRVCAVAGFPFGASHREIKAAEASLAVSEGADEIDMVVNLGALKTGDLVEVGADIKVVRAAVRGAVLKVIIEVAVLTEAELISVVGLAADAGADLVKTSTGYHPSGGATVAAVSAMRTALAGRGPGVNGILGIKASGGVRTVEFARTLIAAGATRLGTSSGVALVS
jgi:deoxyribose-phosphate aldolase